MRKIVIFVAAALLGFAQNADGRSIFTPKPMAADSVNQPKSEVVIPESSIVDEVIWVVGDEPILKSDVEAMRQQMEVEKIPFKGDPDCSGIIAYNYYAGEQVTELTEGRPMVFRSPESKFTIQNLMRSLVYSTVATLKIGMDILTSEEKVKLDRIYAHGGLFKTPVPSQSILAAALGSDVTLMNTAGEGGAWGIALLAAYMVRKDRSETLSGFLNAHVFAGAEGSTVPPADRDIEGIESYMKLYKAGLGAERAAVLA